MGIGVIADEKLDIDGNLKVRGELILKDSGDGKLLIGKDGKFNSTTIGGAISIDKEGVTVLNEKVLSNKNIIDDAKIEVSKTLLNVENSQMELVDNKISIKDVYVTKYAGVKNLYDQLNITIPSIFENANSQARISLYNPLPENSNKFPSYRLGDNEKNYWELYQSGNKHFGIFRMQEDSTRLALGINSINGNVGIGYSGENRTFNVKDKLSVNGNIRSTETIYTNNIKVAGDGFIENLTVDRDFEVNEDLLVNKNATIEKFRYR